MRLETLQKQLKTEIITESSLNRIIDAHSEDFGFVVMTGFLASNSKKQNLKNNVTLVSTFQIMGVGTMKLKGGYTYQSDDPEGRYKKGEEAQEESFLIPFIPPEFRSEEYAKFAGVRAPKQWPKFLEHCQFLAKLMGQESILVKPPGNIEVYLLFIKDGSLDRLGTLKLHNVSELGEFWSKALRSARGVGWSYAAESLIECVIAERIDYGRDDKRFTGFVFPKNNLKIEY